MIQPLTPQMILWASIVVLALGLGLGLIALLRFRQHSSRLLVVDLMGLASTGLMAAWGILGDQAFWLDVALLFVLIGVVGTLALARYLNLQGGEEG